MRRNFLIGLILCLVPTALTGVFVGLAIQKESEGKPGFRRGIDLAGGTILVYEVALKPDQESLSSDQIRELAENLKRRIDPNDLKNVVVRPVGTSRIEIILPHAASAGGKEGSTDNEIQEVKNLVGQVGVLEFRILANNTDDIQGIKDARKIIDSAVTDPEMKKRLDLRAAEGRPPIAPDGTYQIFGTDISYEWVPLGKEELESMLVEHDDKNGKMVSGPVWDFDGSMGYDPTPFLEQAEKDKQAQLTALAASLSASAPAGVRVLPVYIKGNANAEVLKYAAAHQADCIVMATHGRTGFSHFLFGSVAEKIVRTSPCPVLTIKPEHVVEAHQAAQKK